MGIPRAVAATGDGFLDRVFCVFGAIGFAQTPEFIQQYLQRLGGHVDEARRQVEQFRHAAEQSGVTLDRLIAQTNANSDAAVAKLGGVMTDASVRLQSLESAQTAITQASAWERPFVFARHMDSDIAHATWNVFRPALPTTAEGLVYGMVGMLVILFVYHLFVRVPISTGYRVWKKKQVERTIKTVA